MKLLVTGGAGFIGSAVIRHIRQNMPLTPAKSRKTSFGFRNKLLRPV